MKDLNEYPTPRTDYEEHDNDYGGMATTADFARQLERENGALREALKSLTDECSKSFMAHCLVSTPTEPLIKARNVLAATEPK